MKVSYKILDLKLTYKCNNNCNYCCQDRMLRTVDSELSIDQIRTILDKEQNISKVVLTGGEATLSKNLEEIVKLIRRRGITNIQLQSNAKKLSEKKYLERLVVAGINSFGISLHGCNASMHEAFTGTKGSFDKVIKALENLRDFKLPVALNCVITKHNVCNLEDILQFVEKNKFASSIQFAFIHITGKATTEIIDYVKISEAAKKIKEAISYSKDFGIKIYTEAIPFCLMEGFEKNVSELWNKDNIITYDFRERRDFSESISDKFKSKDYKCKNCLFNPMCDGTWIEYPKIFGYDEFIPVTRFRSEY